MTRPAFPHGVMFHRFHADGARPAGQGSVTPAQLERIVDLYGRRHILDPEEWLSRLGKGSLRAKDVCLTFDDGLRCQYDVALPVLEALGLKAFWFVFSSVFEGGIERAEIYNRFATGSFPSFGAFCAAFLESCPPKALARLDSPAFARYRKKTKAAIPFYTDDDLRFRFLRNELPSAEFGRVIDGMIRGKGLTTEKLARGVWMTDAQLKALTAEGHCVGLHSYDHPFQLAKLTPREQEEQYERNMRHVSAACGRRPVTMSHPLNSYGAATLRLLAKKGIICGFRSVLKPPTGRRANPGPLELAREDPTNLLTAA